MKNRLELGLECSITSPEKVMTGRQREHVFSAIGLLVCFSHMYFGFMGKLKWRMMNTDALIGHHPASTRGIKMRSSVVFRCADNHVVLLQY